MGAQFFFSLPGREDARGLEISGKGKPCFQVRGLAGGEFSVALRTGVFDGEVGWVYAGCGIVEGSVADDEYDEIGMKLKTVLSAFDGEEVADGGAR